MQSVIRTAVIAAIVLAIPLHSAGAQRASIAPEAATGRNERAAVAADRSMVAAANPYAVDAGLEMLRAGGTATDAAIAVQLVLGLVEPQSSGLGGGAFVLHWDAGRRDLVTYDARETAPAAARPDRFIVKGAPMPFDKAVFSGLSVGVPAVPRLLEAMHHAHGRLPWARLFEPAIRLAEDGFRVSRRLHYLARWEGPEGFSIAARRYFFDAAGNARAEGSLLKNPEYADTLRRLAAEGAAGFYQGPVGAAIVRAVAEAPNARGDLTQADLESYVVKQRPPLCSGYRAYRICGMGPPSSGGLAVAQTLALVEPFELGRGPREAMNPLALHLVAEAQKLAFADRDRYVADPDFVTLPPGLLDPGYLADRRRLIDPTAPMARPSAGQPASVRGEAQGDDATVEGIGTSHFSIVDADGNAIAMTTTIESAFGSRLWAAGFLLNNQLTDFSFRSADPAGRPIANRVEAGKRPRSSMAPTIVFDSDGAVKAVAGSPGGARIILYVVKALVAVLDWNLDPQDAVALPNFGSRGTAFEIENDPSLSWAAILRPWLSRPSLWYALQARGFGHEIAPDFMTSGLHIVVRRDGRLAGGADPRREGIARGE